MKRAARRTDLFPVNAWPPFVDALALVLAAFVLLMVIALVAQKALATRMREREREVATLRADKDRMARRMSALAATGMVEVEEGKVILQGEVLFDSGSDELRPAGRDFLLRLAPQLGSLLAAEPDQMVLVGGHTDDKLIRNSARFASNWELSTARATAVTRVLMGGGVPARQIVAAGFGAEHPRTANSDEAARRRNRRIEVLLVPIHAVASR
ncbi:MAG TPA: OmpA family protein [Polyangia bacterium]